MAETFTYKLAVIIVNYNVEHFLEQCLNSVRKALKNVPGEVFVVDNNSIDGSVEMVRKRFPEFRLIDNKQNLGFSKANNQAIRLSDSEYVLLLNPDTVVEEDTFEKVVAFMDEHPDAGGLGVRMLDGKGNFLPESKRGLPTPPVAFYKIFGIARLFPKSKRFGRYHLGYLDEFETHEIEILSGAFMLMRKTALDKVGLLDEAFFMYGEDIDLSYRILKGGYKNYYFPETRIIHYKGESTKKSSVNYVFVFYRAMVIFAQKHFSQKNARLFSFLINSAIYFRAFLAICARFIRKLILPAFDFLYLYGGLYALTNYWKTANISFPDFVFRVALPLYTLVWMSTVFFTGGYDRPTRLRNYISGSLVGMILILIVYALIPKEWQFSRLYILIGTGWCIAYYWLSRTFLRFAMPRRYQFHTNLNKRFAIIGSAEERERVSGLLRQTTEKIEAIEYLTTADKREADTMGTLSQLDQVVYLHKIDEIIFCAKDISAGDIIYWMSQPTSANVDYKIAQPDGYYLIGSNSIDTAGDLYTLNINAINSTSNRRNKRFFDLLISLLFLLTSPLTCWLFQSKKRYFSNLFSVLIGTRTIVGYEVNHTRDFHMLPRLKPGILRMSDAFGDSGASADKDKLNLIYARDYSIFFDWKILKKSWRKLDR